MDIYSLSRNFFDWSFENPEKISPTHTALYFFAIEHSNRLGWKKKFGFPTSMAKDAIGIKSYNTYSKVFNDLVEWGFFELIEKSTNQYSANIIALSNFSKATDKALDKALIKHRGKQRESIDSIDIQVYNSTNLQDTVSEFQKYIDNPENESITFYVIKYFLLLKWKPAEDETIESLRLWVKEVFSENEITSPTKMKSVIEKWYDYWKEEKQIKNVKSKFRSTIKFSI